MGADDAITLLKLVKQRGTVKACLTRLKNSLTPANLSDASLQMLKIKEQRAIELFKDYTNLAMQIDDDEDPTQVEENYYVCLDLIRTKMEGMTSSSSTASNAGVGARLKLPHIQIPEFSGNYLEYKQFIELFSALIHDDKNIPDIQKFVYLRGFLKGEAFDLIKNLPVQGSSYNVALNMIKDRYDNSHKIVNEYISKLLDMNPIGKSTVTSLRNFISEAKQHVAALKNLKEPVDQWDSILVCILSRKLDLYTNRAYCLDKDASQPHTFTDFIKYLEDRALALENSENNSRATTMSSFPSQRKVQGESKVAFVASKEEKECYFCGKHDHKLFSCPKFLLTKETERIEFVKSKKLCKVCLNGHPGKCRFHFKYSHCKQNHNTLLHTETNSESTNQENVSLLSGLNNNKQVLLPTAKVKVLTKDDRELVVRALLDSGSQSSFISTQLAEKLGKKLSFNSVNIKGIGNTEKNINNSLQLDIFSCAYPYKANVTCLVVDKITCNLPQSSFNLSDIDIPSNIVLADDTFNESNPIDILLDAGVFFQALLPQPEEQYDKFSNPAQATSSKPRLVATTFGFVIAGNIPSHPLQNDAVCLFCQECKSDVADNIIKFWQSEAAPEVFTEHTSEQTHCEQHFQDTIKLSDNKFEVTMPLKIPIYDVNNTLGDSLGLALRRFLNLEKRLQKDRSLFEEYQAFIHEYIDLGHASYIDITSYDLSHDAVYFMPHHPVIRENAVSTRLRTVFDGSMKTSNNSTLHT